MERRKGPTLIIDPLINQSELSRVKLPIQRQKNCYLADVKRTIKNLMIFGYPR
jgi:hypothetical protein